MTKDKTPTKAEIDKLTTMMKKKNISCIMHIPLYGTVASMSDELGRMKVLDHAKTELLFEDKIRSDKAEAWLVESSGVTNEINPTYIG